MIGLVGDVKMLTGCGTLPSETIRRIVSREVVAHFFKCGTFENLINFRDVAQLGSAPRLGRGGRTFKSCHPDHLN